MPKNGPDHDLARSVWSASSLLPLWTPLDFRLVWNAQPSGDIRQRQQAARTPNASRNMEAAHN